MASAVPQQHLTSRDAVDVVAQIAVWTKDDFLILGQAAHNLLGVGRSNHHIGHRLDGRTGIDVADDRVIGVLVDKTLKLVGRAAVGQRAAGTQIGHDDRLVGTQDLGCLAHEVNTAQDDYRRIGLCCQLCQGKAVADVVGQLLDFLALVVVRHDHSVALTFQAQDFLSQVDTLLDGFIDIAFFNIHIIYIVGFKFLKT